jgi:hypothetical protein
MKELFDVEVRIPTEIFKEVQLRLENISTI